MTDSTEQYPVHLIRLWDPQATDPDSFEFVCVNGGTVSSLDWMPVLIARSSATAAAKEPALFLIRPGDAEAYDRKVRGGDTDAC